MQRSNNIFTQTDFNKLKHELSLPKNKEILKNIYHGKDTFSLAGIDFTKVANIEHYEIDNNSINKTRIVYKDKNNFYYLFTIAKNINYPTLYYVSNTNCVVPVKRNEKGEFEYYK